MSIKFMMMHNDMHNDTHDDTEDDYKTAAERNAAARSTWTSVVVNLALTALQISVGIFGKSQALIADGIHSLSDWWQTLSFCLPAITVKKMRMKIILMDISVLKQQPR
jgi:Co/Zn/Cd efflux system component